jgi:hypothetical protein
MPNFQNFQQVPVLLGSDGRKAPIIQDGWRGRSMYQAVADSRMQAFFSPSDHAPSLR